MKKVNQLTVKVTYAVGLGDLEMPEDIYNKLLEHAEKFKPIDSCNMGSADAAEWLNSNIKEADAMDWQWEIEEIE